MRKLEAADVVPLDEYLERRDALLAAVREARAARRVRVGERIALTFENRTTVLHQVQEMLRVEQVRDPTRIADEVATYNDLIADDGELRATFFVEITDRARIRSDLDSLVGLEKQGLWLVVAGTPIPAEFEPGHAREDRISAVHFVRFPVDRPRRDAIRPGADVRVLVEHPNYHAEARLDDATLAALAEDLAAAPAASTPD